MGDVTFLQTLAVLAFLICRTEVIWIWGIRVTVASWGKALAVLAFEVCWTELVRVRGVFITIASLL